MVTTLAARLHGLAQVADRSRISSAGEDGMAARGHGVAEQLQRIPEADDEGKYESAREHGMHALRHFYASALLDAGENIKAVSEYMGHADPALTLRVHAHLMPDSRERARRAIDTVFQRPSDGDHGPQTAK